MKRSKKRVTGFVEAKNLDIRRNLNFEGNIYLCGLYFIIKKIVINIFNLILLWAVKYINF